MLWIAIFGARRSDGLGLVASRGVMNMFRRAVAVLERHLELRIFAIESCARNVVDRQLVKK